MLGVSDEALQRVAEEEQIRRRKERRERIATAALASVRFNPRGQTMADYNDEVSNVALRALRIADALIAKLDRDGGPC
jgi:hypothetical protein